MPRPDTVAAAHGGDRPTEWPADRRGQGLDRARRQVRPLLPPCLHLAGAAQASGASMLRQEKKQKDEALDEPLRQMRGCIRTGPIRIGGIGFGRNGEWVAHNGRVCTTV